MHIHTLSYVSETTTTTTTTTFWSTGVLYFSALVDEEFFVDTSQFTAAGAARSSRFSPRTKFNGLLQRQGFTAFCGADRRNLHCWRCLMMLAGGF